MYGLTDSIFSYFRLLPKRIRPLLLDQPQLSLSLQINRPQQPTREQSHLEVRELYTQGKS